MKNLAFATIEQLQELIHAKKISREELLDFFLKRFSTFDKELGSALEIFDKNSILAASAQQGFLCGIPGIIKDNIAQKNRKLSCASKILQNFYATYDATAIQHLKQAGALLIGRANMDEFAMGSSTEYSAFQKTRNPWNHDRVPGGSSGGSIAAVAAGLVPWALGSETGGSVRQPAAFCGIVGLKPTYGLISRYGLVAYSSSMDQIGIATRTVKDNAIILSALAGKDPLDSSTLAQQPKDYTKKLDKKLPEKLRIGVIENALHAQGVNTQVVQAIEQAAQEFKKLGAHIEYVKIPMMDYAAAVYFILSRAQAASNLARFDGVKFGLRVEKSTLNDMYKETRHEGFGQEVKARIIIGNYVLSFGHAAAFYRNAKKVQQLLRQEFEQMFKMVDVLITPTSPNGAFKFNAFADNHLEMDLQDYFTCAMNIAGIPAISIPCGFTQENLPIGLQLIGPHLSEELLYKTSYAYQSATPWHTMYPSQYE